MRTLLLTGTALITLTSLNFAQAASAETPGSSKYPSNRQKQASDPRDEEIATLKAEVDALTRRLDADEAAQQAVTKETASAQSTAAAAQTQAAAALTQSQAVQAQVAQAAAAPIPVPPAPLPSGWWDRTTIGGRAFFNVSNIDQSSTDLTGKKTANAQNGTETELKRFYLSVDHKFDNVFSADITTDFRYGANGLTKDTAVFVKKAYLQAKLSDAFFVRIGAADLPWVPYDESLFGYRFIEKAYVDRINFGTSTDWGVHIGGTFGNGLVSYAASAIDGAGFKTLSRSSDTVDLEGRISVNPIKSISIGIGGYEGKLGKSAANLPETATPHTASRIDAIAAYTDKRIRFGVEYFAARNWNTVTSPSPDKSNGWSSFGSFAFTPRISAFARYDWTKPSTELNPNQRDNYFYGGFDFKPIAPVDLALVYKHEKMTHGLISTANGTIGGPAYGTYDEFGLFGQFTF